MDENQFQLGAHGPRILLARHGQTEWNLQGRVQGRRDSPLTELGLSQAAALAEAWGGQGISRVICSPAGRARATAQVVATRLGCVLSEDAGLVEQDFGQFEGCLRPALQREYGDLDRYFRGAEHGDGLTPPDGEAFLDAARRMHAAVGAYAQGGTVGMISHGNAMQALIWLLTGATGDSGRFRHGNASFSELRRHGDTFEVVRSCVADHLLQHA